MRINQTNGQVNKTIHRVRPALIAGAGSLAAHFVAFTSLSSELVRELLQYGLIGLMPLSALCFLVSTARDTIKTLAPSPEAKQFSRQWFGEQRQALAEQARTALRSYKETGTVDLDWGAFLVRAEYLEKHHTNGSLLDALSSFERFDNNLALLRTKIREVAAKAPADDPLARFQRVFDHLQRSYAPRYRLKQGTLYQRLNGKGGNCESQCKLFLAVVNEVYDWADPDCAWRPAVANYADHVELVLVEKDWTGEIYDPTKRKILTSPPTAICEPLVFARAYLLGRGLDPVVEAADVEILPFHGTAQESNQSRGKSALARFMKRFSRSNSSFNYDLARPLPYSASWFSRTMRPITSLLAPLKFIPYLAADFLSAQLKTKTLTLAAVGLAIWGGYQTYRAYHQYGLAQLACDSGQNPEALTSYAFLFGLDEGWNFFGCPATFIPDSFLSRNGRIELVLSENIPEVIKLHNLAIQEIMRVTVDPRSFVKMSSLLEEARPFIELRDRLERAALSDLDGYAELNGYLGFVEDFKIAREEAIKQYFGQVSGAQALAQLQSAELADIIRTFSPEELFQAPMLMETLPFGLTTNNSGSNVGQQDSPYSDGHDSQNIPGQNGNDQGSRSGTTSLAVKGIRAQKTADHVLDGHEGQTDEIEQLGNGTERGIDPYVAGLPHASIEIHLPQVSSNMPGAFTTIDGHTYFLLHLNPPREKHLGRQTAVERQEKETLQAPRSASAIALAAIRVIEAYDRLSPEAASMVWGLRARMINLPEAREWLGNEEYRRWQEKVNNGGLFLP